MRWGTNAEVQFTRPNGVRMDTAPPAPRWRDTAEPRDAGPSDAGPGGVGRGDAAPSGPGPSGVGSTSPLAPTTARLTRAGIVIGPRTGWPQWYGERFDVGHVIDVLRQNEARERGQEERASRPPS